MTYKRIRLRDQLAMDVVTNLLAVIEKEGWEEGIQFVKNLQHNTSLCLRSAASADYFVGRQGPHPSVFW